ncbi:FtsK/SpoIIIE domain-containing protein [Mycolicibacterium fallax]|uniref:Uncharacterized protein n=1 Tax=Mycolicibacterium fallax TaxID=1793 RepID=A0A1X1R072_MYCFA|nr:FtsK/SpoIIIE domain-containing protein [Mycolicibacterium fallax]ORU97247.1 hypothetical protein AWC04_18360 [Mycolicibacterium fallax]BBY97861.1 hypothetical protein MFAL_13280 [Mycolicibacterium fallax]
MSEFDDLFGLGDDLSAPEPAPKPRPKTRAPQPDPAPEFVDRAAEADAKAEQARRLAAQAAELAELAERVSRCGQVQGPQADEKPAEVTAREHVIDRWNRYTTVEQVTRLGLPAGSRLRAIPHGANGVQVQVRVPLGTVLVDAARGVVGLIRAWEWGDYAAAPVDASRFTLTRGIVGEDPAQPWRAAGKTAAAIYAQDTAEGKKVSRLLFERAGLTVKKSDGSVLAPRILAREIGPRGPELLVRLPGGLSVRDAVKAEGTLASLFRCPDLRCEAEGTHLRIKLNTRPAVAFPKFVHMEPTQFWLPHSPEQRFVVAPKLVLPVGVTAAGERIEVPLAKRPHVVIAGTSGAGKTRSILTMITGLALQGAAVAIGAFKVDPDLEFLYGARMPGVVHYSTTIGGISRLLLWLRDELERRSALMPLLARRGISRPVWEPVVVFIDEWGQGLDELLGSADPAERGAGAAMVNVASKIFAQGRSFALHLVLSTQHTYASAIPGRIAQNAATRIVFGRPKPGPAGPIEVLFKDDKAAAVEAAEGITDGMRGRGIVADAAGKVQQFQAHYGYTPAEHPETAGDAELAASWARTRDALERTPRVRRWGWRFPLDGSGEWQGWSLFPGDRTTGELPTVAQLPVVVLDGIDGRPDRAAGRWDPLSDAYDPGVPLLNPDHIAPASY